ncbi:MAG: ArsA family ATPase [Actinobacteria bacterium]|nr:MAG: ArsA family ATPase [Actinomycetota bacterium]
MATGTLARVTFDVRAVSWPAESRSPGLSSWMTSTSLWSLSAALSESPMKSATMGSTRPLTSITSIAWVAAGWEWTGAAMANSTPVKKDAIASVLRAGRALIDGLRDGKELVDPARFCSQSRLVIVAGKGGVGKTTVTAALAVMAARAGLRTLIVEVEGKTGLGAAFGRGELSYDEIELAERIRARTLTPDQALLEYLEDHGMRRLSKRLTNTGFLDVVATAAPGIKDILVLGKVKQLEREGDVDLIVLDAPAAGHAVTFLQSARGLLDAVRVGPVRTQAEQVQELLADPARCQVLLVTLPEETPVNEAVETADRLRERVGVHLLGIVVNGLYPPMRGIESAAALLEGVPADEAEPLRAAAAFRQSRNELQREQLGRLREGLALPQLRLPFLFSPELGPAEISGLADALTDSVGALETVP